MAELLSMREYAKLRGVSPRAVSKAAKAGRINLIDGKINPEVADKQWSENTRINTIEHQFNSTVATPTPRVENDCETMADAQFRHEKAKARKAEIEAAKLEMKVVEIEDVTKTWERHIDAIKNRMLLVESKVPPECRAQVSREVRAALRELSEQDAA